MYIKFLFSLILNLSIQHLANPDINHEIEIGAGYPYVLLKQRDYNE